MGAQFCHKKEDGFGYPDRKETTVEELREDEGDITLMARILRNEFGDVGVNEMARLVASLCHYHESCGTAITFAEIVDDGCRRYSHQKQIAESVFVEDGDEITPSALRRTMCSVCMLLIQWDYVGGCEELGRCGCDNKYWNADPSQLKISVTEKEKLMQVRDSGTSGEV